MSHTHGLCTRLGYATTPAAPLLLQCAAGSRGPLRQLYKSASIKIVLIYVTSLGPACNNSSVTPAVLV